MTAVSLSLTVDTPVLTIRGQIAVGSLVPEDHVILQTGHTAKVSWISSEFLYEKSACNEADMAILIEADAVLDGVPMRDLLVLPTQIIFLNGALLPADTLVNGLSIRRIKTFSLTYREIKLCVSGYVYAGGLPVGPCLEGHFKTDDNPVIKAVKSVCSNALLGKETTNDRYLDPKMDLV